MQVDPFVRFNNNKMSSSHAKVITLEGKSRLPARLQEAVIDIGNLVHCAQSTSISGEFFQLPQLVKNFSVLETTINNTTNTLKKLEKTLDRGADSNKAIEQSLPFVQNLMGTLQLVDAVHNPLQHMKLS